MFGFFKKSFSVDEFKLFSFLQGVKLFEQLNNEELSLICPHLHLRKYKNKEVVFFCNDPSSALYIIRTGKVSLNVDIRDDFELLTSIKTRNAFGENSLIPKTKRIYTSIVESEDAELYVLPQIMMLDIFEDYPTIKAKVMSSYVEIYNHYTMNLIKSYRSAYGFFELKMVYDNSRI